MLGRIVLVADLDSHWAEIVKALEQELWEVDILVPRTKPGDVVACAARSAAILVVDLASDPSGGLTTIVACRDAAGPIPVIAVATNPSLELTRSIRLAGAFYLALQPVGLDEMRSILQSALVSLERNRPDASRCHATRRILIADDDQDFVASTTALLQAYGYSVSTAASGREALEKASAEHPDLIVLDVMMEHDSAGYEVNEAVKYAPGYESIRHVPILMVSAIPIDPATRFSTACEVDMVTPNAYLTKPLDIPRFLSEVTALLGEQRGAGVGAR